MHRGSFGTFALTFLLLPIVSCGDSGDPEDTPQATGGAGDCVGGPCPAGGTTGSGGVASGGAHSGGAAIGGATITGGALNGGAGGSQPTGGSVGAGGMQATGGSGASEGLGGDYGLELEQGSLTLWYDDPAGEWTEALPVGNGRLGAMVFGGPGSERLQLNEETFWSGGPSRNDNPNSLGALSSIRQQIFAGNFTQAEIAINQNVTATQLHGSIYQTIGDLQITFPGHENPTAYYRELDLKRAVATTEYEVAGVTYTREVFASQPDQVIVVRLSASQPGSLSFSLGLDGPLAHGTTALDDNTLQMTGTSSSHEGVTGQVDFDARVRIQPAGGTASTDGDGLQVAGANEVVILISVATNFVDYETLTADPAARATQADCHGQTSQRGERGVQIVAPRSIIAWV